MSDAAKAPEMGEFKAGEVVKLNSDGPLMTVLSIDGDEVKCAWAVKGDIKEKSFPAAALTKAVRPAVLEKLISSIKQEEHQRRHEQHGAA